MTELPSFRCIGVQTARPPFSMRRPIAVAGRGPRCAVRLNAPTISDSHALLVRIDHTTWIAALNGETLVNGGPVTEKALESGDTIGIGPFTFEYATNGSDVQPPPPVCACLVDTRSDSVHVLERRITVIGNSSTAHVRLDASQICLCAALVSLGDGHVLIDLSSSDGPRLNGSKISGTCKVTEGDTLEFGTVALRYQSATPSSKALTAVADPSDSSSELPEASLKPMLGRRRRTPPFELPRHLPMSHDAMADEGSAASKEPPAPRTKSTLFTALLMLALIALGNIAIWFLLQPGFVVQGAIAFDFPQGIPQSAQREFQARQELLLIDDETRAAARKTLADLLPGFLAPDSPLRNRTSISWVRGGTQERMLLLISVRGDDKTDVRRVESLLAALYDANHAARSSADITELREQLATADSQLIAQELQYQKYKAAELREKIRVFSLTALAPEKIAALQKTSQQAREKYQATVEQRIRLKVQADIAARKNSSSTQPTSDSESANLQSELQETLLAEQKAKDALESVQNDLQKAQSDASNLRQAQSELQVSTSQISALENRLKNAGQGSATTRPASPTPIVHAPQRVQLIPDQDRRALWSAIVSAGLVTLFALSFIRAGRNH